MSLNAMLRRMPATSVVRKALITATVVLAFGATAGSVDASARPGYPPTTPCALTVTARAASSSVEFVLVGSGLGTTQRVNVVLNPSATRVGSFRTDLSGAFTAVVALPTEPVRGARQLTAASATAFCSVQSPEPGPAGGAASSGGAPSATGPSGPATGSTPPGKPQPSGTGVGSTPVSPSEVTPAPSSGPHSSPARSHPSTILGLGLSVGITIAVALGLIILGGLAVLLLTRRSG